MQRACEWRTWRSGPIPQHHYWIELVFDFTDDLHVAQAVEPSNFWESSGPRRLRMRIDLNQVCRSVDDDPRGITSKSGNRTKRPLTCGPI